MPSVPGDADAGRREPADQRRAAAMPATNAPPERRTAMPNIVLDSAEVGLDLGKARQQGGEERTVGEEECSRRDPGPPVLRPGHVKPYGRHYPDTTRKRPYVLLIASALLRGAGAVQLRTTWWRMPTSALLMRLGCDWQPPPVGPNRRVRNSTVIVGRLSGRAHAAPMGCRRVVS